MRHTSAAAHPTPLFTRHMLGALEDERDQRLRRDQARWTLVYSSAAPLQAEVIELPVPRRDTVETDVVPRVAVTAR
jgi:hypothetical protein